MTILATKSTLTLEISRRFAAPPARVFDAWVGREWGEWLPPNGATCQVAAIDARPGGTFRVDMTMPDGRQIEVFGTYRDVVRPERLVFTWEGDCFPGTTIVTLGFEADGDGTLLTLRQEGFQEEGMRAGFDSGWTGAGGSFDKLAVLLKERLPG